MPRRYLLAALVPALFLLSCAAPAELARRSGVALQQGDASRAYELARKALDKEPKNPAAREAMAAAAARIAGDTRGRILQLAPVDTIRAAEQTLAFSEFRAETRGYGVELPVDETYDRAVVTLRAAAGRIYYGIGVTALHDGRPRYAYGELTKASHYVAAYRDLDRQLKKSWDLAQTRVVLVPVVVEDGRGDFSRELTDHLYRKLASEIRGESFRFTHLVPEDEVWNAVTVAQLGRMERGEAVSLARKLGAARVVWMRVHGIDSDTRTDSFRDQIYQRIAGRDTSGRPVDRWEPVDLQVVMRERTVHVAYDFDVVGTDEEQTLARRGDELSNTARTVFTAFQPQAGFDDYALCPAPVRASDPDRAKRVESRYKDVVGGSMPLPKLLERAKRDRARTRYRPEYRNEFMTASSTPIFLDDLPPATDLAFAALLPAWEKIHAELRRLDAVDDVDAPPVNQR